MWVHGIGRELHREPYVGVIVDDAAGAVKRFRDPCRELLRTLFEAAGGGEEAGGGEAADEWSDEFRACR
jgi:hypothetical protein